MTGRQENRNNFKLAAFISKAHRQKIPGLTSGSRTTGAQKNVNLPNKFTLTRIILVPVFMIFVSLTSLDSIVDGNFNATFYLLAGIVFAAASFTDFLDGHLARKWNMVTDFGKFADPLADKLLTTVAFIYMMRDGVCSPVVLCIILAREFAVSGLRMVAAGAKDGKVIAANMWGKVKSRDRNRMRLRSRNGNRN